MKGCFPGQCSFFKTFSAVMVFSALVLSALFVTAVAAPKNETDVCGQAFTRKSESGQGKVGLHKAILSACLSPTSGVDNNLFKKIGGFFLGQVHEKCEPLEQVQLKWVSNGKTTRR